MSQAAKVQDKGEVADCRMWQVLRRTASLDMVFTIGENF